MTKANKKRLDKLLRKFVPALHDVAEKGAMENVPDMLKEVVKLIEVFSGIVQRPCAELAVMVTMLSDLYATADVIFYYTPIDFCAIALQCQVFHRYLQQTLSKP